MLAKVQILLYIFGFVVLSTPLVSRLACGRILNRAAKLSCRIGYCCAGYDFGMSVGTLRCCSGIRVPS